jgi:hypothetical protein
MLDTTVHHQCWLLLNRGGLLYYNGVDETPCSIFYEKLIRKNRSLIYNGHVAHSVMKTA